MTGILAALGSALSWAVGAILFKRIGEQLPPLAMTLFKALLSILLLISVWLFSSKIMPSWTHLGLLALSGLMGISLADCFFFYALRSLRARDVVLLMTCSHVATVLLAVIFLGERPLWLQWIGICLIIGGVSVVMLADVSSEDNTSTPRGILFGVLSAILMSASLVIAKPGLAVMSALQATLIRMTVGAIGVFLFGIVSGQLLNWAKPLKDFRLSTSFLVAVCVVTFGGFWLSLLALKLGDVSINSTLIAVEPLFALILSRFFLKESVTISAGAGTMIATVGVALLAAFSSS